MSDTAKPPAPLKPETLVLHAGYAADPATNAVAVPIYQTTSYQFGDTEHASNLFALKELGNIYTRIMNPTTDVLEKRIAALEGGVAALALASGQAASAFAVQNLARAGDNIVSSTDLYGGTWNLFANTLQRPGHRSPLRRPVRPGELPQGDRRAHPRLLCRDAAEPEAGRSSRSREVAKIGRPLGIPLIMDNTAAPVLCKPLDHGAAIVVYSTTKYIGGHGTSIGGMIVDGGNFRLGGPCRAPAAAEHARSQLSWRRLDRGDEADRPRRLHHQGAHDAAARPRRGDVAVQRLPVHPGAGDAAAAHARALRECARPWRDFLSSAIRRSRRSSTPAFEDGEARRRADAYLKGGYGGLVGFELKDGREAGRALHRRAEAVLPRRQYRRRPQPGDPSGLHDALAAYRGGAVRDRRDGRLCPAFGRHRAYR